MVRSAPVGRIPRQENRKVKESILAPWARSFGLGLLVLAATSSVSAEQSTRAPSTVILVSLDGTRPADLGSLPTLSELARRGFSAESMTPVFPSNTFPNHVSLVTGVQPQKHGIVNNSFRDPARGVFRKRDIPSWIEVEPLWSLLQREGVVSASYHWVGSEGPWPGGGGPLYWMPFDGKTSELVKVEQVLDWLQVEQFCQRPRFVTMWFHGADHPGHVHGPGSKEVDRSLRGQDKAIARLWEGLSEIGLRDTTTLVFLSDHGMAAPASSVDLATRLANAGVAASVFGIGGFATVDLDTPSARNRAKALSAIREGGLRGYLREEAPPSLAVDHERFGDIVVLAPSTTAIVRPGVELRGFHGYPPSDPAMSAFLVLLGPGVAAGETVPRVRSIDIAPTVLALLGVEVPGWMEGEPIPALERAYREATPPQRFAKLHGCKMGPSVP